MKTPFAIAIYASWAVLLMVWLPGYFTARITGKGPQRISQIATTVLLYVSVLLLFFPNLPDLNRAVTPRTPAFELTGLVLAVAGVGFAIWARLTLGRNWSDVVMTVKADHELVRTGPYGIVRHPIYTGLLAAMMGTALTFGALGSYIGVVAGLVALMARIDVEEKLMGAQFGDAHEAYRRQARKLIPFVW